MEDVNKIKGWKLWYLEKWVCIKYVVVFYEGWYIDLYVFLLKNLMKYFVELMYVKKNVKLIISIDFGLICMCVGVYVDGICYLLEVEVEIVWGFVVWGCGLRSKVMYYLFMGVCYVVSVDSGNGCFDRYVIVVVVKINIRS